MQHLDTERIAAFDHEAPTAEELSHLSSCTVCRTERNAFAALTQRSMHLADAPVYPPAPRLTTWESLSTRLRAEGLIKGDGPVDVQTEVVEADNDMRFGNVMRALREPVVATGTPDGPVVALDSWWQRAKPRSARELMRVAAAALFFTVSGAGLNQIRNERGLPESGNQTTSTAGLDMLNLGSTGFSSVDEATKALNRTERDYNRIAMWLTANDASANQSDVLRRRLAALDRVIAASLEELQAAPDDRVLEHHYRSAYEARELTLQQLGVALPVGRSLERF